MEEYDYEEYNFGEGYIQKLPEEGDIELTFMRIYPNFKIIKKKIPLKILSPHYSYLCSDFKKVGIDFFLLFF